MKKHEDRLLGLEDMIPINNYKKKDFLKRAKEYTKISPTTAK